MATEYNATLIKRENLYEGLDIIKVKPDNPLASYYAGQFATLGLKASAAAFPTATPPPSTDPEKMIRRAYSIASSPKQLDYLEFYIVMVPQGELTPRLFQLPLGERLWMGPKITGKFTLESVNANKDILLIATGTGLAPYISMVRTHYNPNSKRKFIVMHGVRTSLDLGYYDELKELDANPNFYYLPMISRPEDSPKWDGLVGRINDHIGYGILEKECKVYLDPERIEVFLCGNPAMIKGMIQMLEPKGYVLGHGSEVGTIHKEDYW